jgi:hypothetical protein
MAIDNDALMRSLQRAAQWKAEKRQLEFRNPKTGEVIWKSNVGPQSDLMWCPEFELLSGGSRGGGKSAGLMVWVIRGNYDLPEDHPCYVTLLNHPKFSAIILRRNATDLREFIDQATPFYEALGAKKKDDPPVFEWKHGPKIYTNHLDGEAAFEKHRGANYPRIGIEELTQIQQYQAYLKLLSVCRTPHPELRPAWSDGVGQILNTTNPDGPGQWVKDRFVEVLDSNGKMIPWGTTMRDPATKLTRVFIPARLSDNPFLGDSYRSTLLMQAEADPALVAAWLHGEWGVTSGTYFKNFRPNGPRDETEPAHARHVIDPVPLMPWWPRFIGMDWGFRDEAVALWGCFNHGDERTHIYREFVAPRDMGSDELGAEIARKSQADLAGLEQHIIPMWLSHECFNKNDIGKTKAELIAGGIERILGKGSVVVAESASKIENLDYGSLDGQMKILLYPSTRMREDIWQHMRTLLRFNPLVEQNAEPDADYVQRLLQQPDGFNRVEQYMAAFKKQRPEPLPALLIWRECYRLIKQLKNARHDEKKVEDIYQGRDGNEHWDALDAARYLLAGMRTVKEKLPKYAFMAQRMEHVSDEVKADPTRMMFVQLKAESDWKKQHKGTQPFSLPRRSSMRVQ